MGPLGDAVTGLPPGWGAPKQQQQLQNAGRALLPNLHPAEAGTRPSAGALAAPSGLAACDWSLCPHLGGRMGCHLPLRVPESSLM